MKHIGHVNKFGCVPSAQVEAGKAVASREHLTHVGDISYVQATQIEVRESFAAFEHIAHVRDTRGEVLKIFNGSQQGHPFKPIVGAGDGSIFKF